MPVVLGRLSRRELLGASLAAAAGAVTRPWERPGAQEQVDPHRFALLSDTHIPGDKVYTDKGTGISPWDHFQQISKELVALKPKPAGVLVSGDCACLDGLPEDYASLVEAVKPIRAGGLTLHFALGNHDRRGNFLKALRPRDAQRNVGGRHISIVRSPRANFFLLDSLAADGRVAGILGDTQLQWLAKTLDANADKPALVMLHHNPDPAAKFSGLQDTNKLYDVLLSRKHVKAWIYGHTHTWRHTQRDGLHLINVPATAWVFAGNEPAGWVDATLKEDGVALQLAALKKDHPDHGQKLDLKWR